MLRWRCHIKTHYLQQLIHVNKNNKQMGEIPKQIKNKHPLLEDVRFSKVASLSILSSSLPLFINSVSKRHTCWFVSFSIVCFSPTGRSLCDCISRTQDFKPNISLKNTQDATYKASALGLILTRWKGQRVWWCWRREGGDHAFLQVSLTSDAPEKGPC